MSYLTRVHKNREADRERTEAYKAAKRRASESGRKGSWDRASQPVPIGEGEKSIWRRAYEAMTGHLSMAAKAPIKVTISPRPRQGEGAVAR